MGESKREMTHEEHVSAIRNAEDFSGLVDSIGRAYAGAQKKTYEWEPLTKEGAVEGAAEEFNPYYFEDGEQTVKVYESEKLKPLQKRFEAFVVDDSSDPELANACRKLESMVFREKFDKSDTDDHREVMPSLYGPVEERSQFIGVLDRKSGELAGSMRVVSGEKASDFTTILDSVGAEMGVGSDEVSAEQDDALTAYVQQYHEHFKPENTWEIGTLAVAKKYRGKGVGFAKAMGIRVSSMLYHSLYEATRKTWGEDEDGQEVGITSWIAMFKQEPFNVIKRYGIPMIELCEQEPRDYYGAENTQPTYTYTRDIAEKVGENSRLTQLGLVYGVGVTAVLNKVRLDVGK